MKKSKYRDRYVLATGYPWRDRYDRVLIMDKHGNKEKDQMYPRSLLGSDVPRYRLVLEKVGGKHAAK